VYLIFLCLSILSPQSMCLMCCTREYVCEWNRQEQDCQNRIRRPPRLLPDFDYDKAMSIPIVCRRESRPQNRASHWIKPSQVVVPATLEYQIHTLTIERWKFQQ
jgi:hypothetical protein